MQQQKKGMITQKKHNNIKDKKAMALPSFLPLSLLVRYDRHCKKKHIQQKREQEASVFVNKVTVVQPKQLQQWFPLWMWTKTTLTTKVACVQNFIFQDPAAIITTTNDAQQLFNKSK